MYCTAATKSNIYLFIYIKHAAAPHLGQNSRQAESTNGVLAGTAARRQRSALPRGVPRPRGVLSLCGVVLVRALVPWCLLEPFSFSQPVLSPTSRFPLKYIYSNRPFLRGEPSSLSGLTACRRQPGGRAVETSSAGRRVPKRPSGRHPVAIRKARRPQPARRSRQRGCASRRERGGERVSLSSSFGFSKRRARRFQAFSITWCGRLMAEPLMKEPCFSRPLRM